MSSGLSTVVSTAATVGIRELKQNASAVVARVAAGETLIVTDRRRPVARLVPLERSSRLRELIDAGQIRLPVDTPAEFVQGQTVNGRYSAPISLDGAGPTLSEVLLAARDEERF